MAHNDHLVESNYYLVHTMCLTSLGTVMMLNIYYVYNYCENQQTFTSSSPLSYMSI